MSPRLKRGYLQVIFLRYKGASREGIKTILHEFCAVSGYHRKHAIRLLRRFKRFQKPKTKKRGRSSLYDRHALLQPLKQISLAANLPCSKRLKALLPLGKTHLERKARFKNDQTLRPPQPPTRELLSPLVSPLP